MIKISYKRIRAEEETNVDYSDMITLLEASELLKVKLPTLSLLIERGEIPAYIEPRGLDMERPQRFTSRKEVTERAKRLKKL